MYSATNLVKNICPRISLCRCCVTKTKRAFKYTSRQKEVIKQLPRIQTMVKTRLNDYSISNCRLNNLWQMFRNSSLSTMKYWQKNLWWRHPRLPMQGTHVSFINLDTILFFRKGRIHIQGGNTQAFVLMNLPWLLFY